MYLFEISVLQSESIQSVDHHRHYPTSTMAKEKERGCTNCLSAGMATRTLPKKKKKTAVENQCLPHTYKGMHSMHAHDTLLRLLVERSLPWVGSWSQGYRSVDTQKEWER